MPTPADEVIRIALVEDHDATRDELVKLLESFRPGVELVATFRDAESFLSAQPGLDLRVVLCDLGLPAMQGTEAIRRLTESAPDVHAIALTAFDDERHVLAALRAGAYGYLLKDETPARLLQGIEEAAQGAHPVSARVAGFLVARSQRVPPPVMLSDREEELAAALARGLSYAECATHMGIALGTVQDYVKRLYRKLDVNSRKEVRAWVERYADGH